MKWKFILMTTILLLTVLFIQTGCVKKLDRTEKLQDLEFTVLSENEIPKELTEEIETQKIQPFQLTFTDQGYLYIVRGYGPQLTSGYSISVKELYETSNAVVIKTELLGPEGEEEIQEITTFPYLVIKLEDRNKHVIFDE